MTIQLPSMIDPNEPSLRLWSGVLSEIPELLQERTDQVARNFLTVFSRRTDLGKHPRIIKTLNSYRAEGELLINRESAAQAEFTEQIRMKFQKELSTAEASSGWDRSRRIQKVNRNYSGSSIEGLPIGV